MHRVEEKDNGDIEDHIHHELESLKQQIIDTGAKLDACKQEQEKFSADYYDFRQQNAQFECFLQQYGEHHQDVKKHKNNKEAMERAIKAKYLNLTSQRSGLVNSCKRIFEAVKKVQNHVLGKELIDWKREQQLAGNGHQMKRSLDTLQDWCEGLADIIWTLRQQVRKLEGLREQLGDPQNHPNILSQLLTDITVTGTFIIERQPPQVMKTNTRFTATVRLLVGGSLSVQMAAPKVSVSIVSENQANELLISSSSPIKCKDLYNSGDILNGNGTMEYHSATKQVSVSFRNLQLKKIKRTEKKGTESVMDEKFSVLFWTEFQVGELNFQLWTLSLPVVVIVHGNQEPQALATVTWDNSFAEWGRRPFVVPDKVTWAQAGQALNTKWTSLCGSPLTEENLYYLACKALRNNNLPKSPDEYNSLVLSWPQFCKETLPDRNFTFWEWFYRILLLTSTHMQHLWKDGYIMGFVTKQAAEALLMNCGIPGCFLLRFSDSELGGITIAYLLSDSNTNYVEMVAPFTTKDLTQRSMADVIFDLNALTVLYPNTPKEALKKFCSSSMGQNPSSSGYVKHILITHVEGYKSVSGESNPSTPAGLYQTLHSAQSPSNFGGIDIDMDASIDIDPCIDVRQILGLTDDFMTEEQNNF